MKVSKRTHTHPPNHPYHYPFLFVLIIILGLSALALIQRYTEKREHDTRPAQKDFSIAGDRFVFTKIGLSFVLPDPAKPPAVGGADDRNALIPLPDDFPPTSKFTVETAVNSDNLPLEKLDELPYGYEHLTPERFTEENETVIEKRAEQTGQHPMLTLKTTTSDTTKYYAFLPRPAGSAEPLVYVFILSVPSSSVSTLSPRITSIMSTLLGSVQFFPAAP